MQAHPTRFLDGDSPVDSDLARWLAEFAERRENRGAVAHWETLAARPARFGELLPALPEPITNGLASLGIERLYTHQVRAIESLLLPMPS